MIPDAIEERLGSIADLIAGGIVDDAATAAAAGLPELVNLEDLARRWRAGEVWGSVSLVDVAELVCAAIAAWEDRLEVSTPLIPEAIEALAGMVADRLDAAARG